MENKHTIGRYSRDALIILLLTIAWFLFDQRNDRNIWYTSFLIVFIAGLVGLLFLVFKRPELRTKAVRQIATQAPRSKPYWTAIIPVVLFFTLPLGIFQSGSARLVILVVWSLVSGLILAWIVPDENPYLIFASVLLVGGVLYRIGAFVNEISSSPFALGWSEGSRMYNASLFFAERLYGTKMPLPVLHPSRYLLQSLPFLVGINSIWVHRFWQVLLWLGMTSWGAWLLAKKVGRGLDVPLFWLSLFLFLFFFQGAVYYHLMVCVVLVLIGYDQTRPLRTLLFVILASLWAGISRINWIPVPGLMAVALYLLDEPLEGKNWIAYLKWPVVWTVVGAFTAFASKEFYQAISGENPAVFDSAFSSQLLWSRLLPNPTFPLGILPAIGLVCLPLLILVAFRLKEGLLKQVHWLRWLGLVGILAAFFGGGVLVSLKIGGGGDLHNLDAFLVFFALIVFGVLSNRLNYEHNARSNVINIQKIPPLLLLLICLVPVWFSFMRAGRWTMTSAEQDQVQLGQIREAIEFVAKEPGPILFVTERQLLTMGEIDGVELYPDYEKVFLMEMAMGNNQEYLENFYRLLDEHTFSAILMEPISTRIQEPWKSFAEENNSYVRKVILPMLMDYQLALSWDNGEINLLIPNGEPELMEQLQEISPE